MPAKTIPHRIKTVIEKADEGDLLEIDRKLYKHWAVYIGKNRHRLWNFFFMLVHPSFTTHNVR